jgi:signal peptidase
MSEHRIWGFVKTVVGVVLLGAVALAGVALIVVPKATGARPLTVLSGSMSPTYQPGDVVIVRPTDPEHLQIGDVITFQAESGDPQLTTHRITGVVLTGEGREYRTQGDANGAVDPMPVQAEQVRGTVWYAVPLVGYAATWVAGTTMRTLIDLTAIGLLLYGGYLITAGALERRRRKPEVAA